MLVGELSFNTNILCQHQLEEEAVKGKTAIALRVVNETVAICLYLEW
jgi:hypothetical protein